MKNWLQLFTILLITGLTFTACSDDEDDHGDNEVTINIISPTPDQVLSDASSVTVKVEISATDENHEIEIILHAEGDTSDEIIEADLHDHDQVVTFEQTVDLSSYPNGQEFHLEVFACEDHDCEERAFADVEFSIQ